jgi:hypothetical protein
MAEGGKDAERRRLAEALRANLKRRKSVARPAQPKRETDAPAEAVRDDRG